MKICGSKTIKVLLFLSIDHILMIHSVFSTMRMRLNYFLTFFDSQHPNIKFTMEKETNIILAFLYVCINNSDLSCLKISTYGKKPSLDYSLISSALLPFLTKLG